MKRGAAALVLVALAPLVLLLILAAGVVSLEHAAQPPSESDGEVQTGTYAQASGPIYYAGTASLDAGVGDGAIRTASIHDLGFGPSDAARVERLIRALKPTSPLAGQGETVLHLGQQFGIDPLLIAQWQLESGMDTVGLNIPGNGGNMIWAAAKPYADRYGCTQGASSLGHAWASCPSVSAGLGIWFEYVGTFYPPRANTLAEYASIYDPCSDPGNIALGLPCGENYATLLLGLVRRNAGPPVAALPPVGNGTCAPLLPLKSSVDNLALPEAARAVFPVVLGNRQFPVTQGWGPSPLGGEPTWLGYPHFHTGVDIGTPVGTPLYSPDDGVAMQRTIGSARIESVRLPNGYTWSFLHLDRQVANGAVKRGELIGYSGNTGYSTGPHLHTELKDPQGRWVAPEQWTCRIR